MICLVTGPPGAGKSLYAVRQIVSGLEKGQFVATNIELTDGWAEAIAKLNWFTRLVPGRVSKKAARYRERLYVSHDLEELFRLRLPGKGEGRGRMVLDEAHNWMNARSWKEGGRERVVKFATQHRKIGWNMYVITQDAEMIDKQVRNLFEYHVHLKNLRRFKVLGIPIFPFNLFMAVTQWAHAQRAIVSRESYRLHRKVARLYDTMATSHGLDDDPALLIMLPVVPDGPPS